MIVLMLFVSNSLPHPVVVLSDKYWLKLKGAAKKVLLLLSMCQCLICDCWWYNYFGICCGGCHTADLVCSCWLCKPEDLMILDPECCHICACDGCGYNHFCLGSVCCAPTAVKEWSISRTTGKPAGSFNGKTIIINNNIPSPIYMHGEGGYQMSTPERVHGGQMNVNGNMGGYEMSAKDNYDYSTNMNVKMNMNTPGVNARIAF
jgi:hypothetical protein